MEPAEILEGPAGEHALLDAYAIVMDTEETAANELPEPLSLWDVFVALQEAAEDEGVPEAEVDAWVAAAYVGLQSQLRLGSSAPVELVPSQA